MPGNVRRSPGKMRRTPRNLRRTPGSLRRTPGNLRRTPGDLSSAPGSLRQILGNPRRIPGMRGEFLQIIRVAARYRRSVNAPPSPCTRGEGGGEGFFSAAAYRLPASRGLEDALSPTLSPRTGRGGHALRLLMKPSATAERSTTRQGRAEPWPQIFSDISRRRLSQPARPSRPG